MCKERENYKYGFQEIENIQTIIGYNVLIEHTSSKFGYLTYEGNIIDNNNIKSNCNYVYTAILS